MLYYIIRRINLSDNDNIPLSVISYLYYLSLVGIETEYIQISWQSQLYSSARCLRTAFFATTIFTAYS